MRSYSVTSAAEALVEVGADLMTDPDFIVAPRGKETHEVRNVTIEVLDPSDCTMVGIGRKWNPKIAVAEFLQLAGGFSVPEAMVAIQPMFAEFLGPHGDFHGAYGVRTGLAMRALVERLQDDLSTRQGVVSVWNNAQDMQLGEQVHKDMPCTTYMNFSIRAYTAVNPMLLMTTHMRSNDVWRGWSYDAFQFMQLQYTLANFLGIDVGPYTHVVDSMHMYVEDMEKFEELKPRRKWLGQMPELFGLSTIDCAEWKHVQEVAQDLFYTPKPIVRPSGNTEEWIVDTGIGKVVSDTLSR